MNLETPYLVDRGRAVAPAELDETVHHDPTTGGTCTEAAVWEEIWTANAYHLDPTMLTGGWVVDLGANVGAFSLLVAASHPAERVLAVEPHPKSHGRLLANLDRNEALVGPLRVRRILALAVAVGAENRRRVEIVGSGPVARTVDPLPDDAEPPPQDRDRYAAVFSLAEIVGMIGGVDDEPEIDFLKFDVEGAEYPTFCDAPRDEVVAALSRVRYLAGEWHPRGRYGELVDVLAETHSVSAFGQPSSGGMIYAHRYDV